MTASTRRSRLFTAGSLLVLALVWWAAALAVGREIILPAPVATGRALAALAARPAFWVHLGATLLRGGAGFLLSYLAGLLVGLAAGLSPACDAVLRPWLAGVRSTPSMALILLALIWFRPDPAAVFVVFLVVFPLVAGNVAEGVRGIDPALREMAAVFGVKRSRTFAELYLPALLPYLAAGATTGLGLTWKVMIAAEVLAGPRWGIGGMMQEARVFLNTPEVMAWTVVVVAVGLFFDRVLTTAAERWAAPWK